MIFSAFAIVLGVGFLPRADWRGVTVYFVSLGIVALAIFSALGNARPHWMRYPDMNHVSVVSMVSDEPVRYYVWVVPENSTAPVAVSFPWNEAAAAQMQGALNHAKDVHGHVRVHMNHGEPEAYVTTVVPLLPKGVGQ